METIRDGDKTLVIIQRDGDWEPGLTFLTPDSAFAQAGCWHYDRGTRLASHIHKHCERTASRTQEVVYVRRGRVRASIYDEDKQPLTEVDLLEGDTAVFLAGGHGYEIMEDGTQVLEVKNGPFVGVERDKEKFE